MRKNEIVLENDMIENFTFALNKLKGEVKRLREIEEEWLLMWATLEKLNLDAHVRENMTRLSYHRSQQTRR
tara:strand:- start:409 stop:621 length:213 start_codon:yes stop_codon:yes gene_type:complete